MCGAILVYNALMPDSQKHHIKELKNALRDIDEGGKEKCTMCRFVLIFSFVTLILVVLFVFLFRTEPQPGLRPLPPELAPPVDPATYQREMLELGQLFHPGMSTSTIAKPSKQLPVKNK